MNEEELINCSKDLQKLSFDLAEFVNKSLKNKSIGFHISFYELLRMTGESNMGSLREQVPEDIVSLFQNLIRNSCKHLNANNSNFDSIIKEQKDEFQQRDK